MAGISGAGNSNYTPPQEMAKEYISEHRVQQMFSSLLSALMMHRPEDPITFMQSTLEEVRLKGAHNVNWETFVFDLHPYRDPARLAYIQDGSSFHEDVRKREEEAAELNKYKPDVFKLTENTPNDTAEGRSS